MNISFVEKANKTDIYVDPDDAQINKAIHSYVQRKLSKTKDEQKSLRSVLAHLDCRLANDTISKPQLTAIVKELRPDYASAWDMLQFDFSKTESSQAEKDDDVSHRSFTCDPVLRSKNG